MTTTVSIYGPNLRGNQAETFHVHAPGCTDTKRGMYVGAERPWEIDVATFKDLTHNVYPPNEFDYDADAEWADGYGSDIRVYPCVGELPTE